MTENNPPTSNDQPSTASDADKAKNDLVLRLRNSVIAEPLQNQLTQQEAPNKREEVRSYATQIDDAHQVVIDVNLSYAFGRRNARDWILRTVKELIQDQQGSERLDDFKNESNQQYVFARLTAKTIQDLINLDKEAKQEIADKKDSQETVDKPTDQKAQLKKTQTIHRIWPDFKARALMNKSVSTVKADAAKASFMASGEGIVWAVADSGIDKTHPHFSNNIYPTDSYHRDFTVTQAADQKPFVDVTGHGTHVAGIIAGEIAKKDCKKLSIYSKIEIENNNTEYVCQEIDSISGMAPKCQLVSLKVLDANNEGDSSAIIAALTHIQEINGYGRDIKIHGVNLSLGYDFDANWYACGKSPLCVEVDRLVKSGVVVVVAAGNTGYGNASTAYNGVVSSGLSMSINDPGNAELAITVGSTHRDKPYTYGVSFFSSKGPTGDGRPKPDLVAPGERIISCAAGRNRTDLAKAIGSLPDDQAVYVEDSGTSMAAPHVSGVIASFLSIRQEFIGQPEVVKNLFMKSATSLNRDPNYQGQGLIDLMRTIQSV